jgi:hypothetical protein
MSVELEMKSTVDEQVAAAIALIDRGLPVLVKRDLVAAGEVTDLLLDVRMLLAAALADAR